MKNKQVELVENKAKYLIDFDDEQKKIIKNQFFPPSTTAHEMQYCMTVAKSLGLNPLLSEIYFVERKANINGQWTSKIEPLAGRNAFRKIANKSGKLESIKTTTRLIDTPKLMNGKWIESQDLVAICEIKRKDCETPFLAEVEYSEYVQKKKDGTPTKFWAEKPKTMLKKVAESQCLRMAFDISGLYDESEIEPVEDIDLKEKYQVPKLQQEIKKTVRRKTKKETQAEKFVHKNEDLFEDAEIVDMETGEVKTVDTSMLDSFNDDGSDRNE